MSNNHDIKNSTGGTNTNNKKISDKKNISTHKDKSNNLKGYLETKSNKNIDNKKDKSMSVETLNLTKDDYEDETFDDEHFLNQNKDMEVSEEKNIHEKTDEIPENIDINFLSPIIGSPKTILKNIPLLNLSKSPVLNFQLTNDNIEILNKCFGKTNDLNESIKINEKNNLHNIETISKMTTLDAHNQKSYHNNLQESNNVENVISNNTSRVNITTETPLQKEVYRLMDCHNTFAMMEKGNKLEIGVDSIKIMKFSGITSKIKRGVIGWFNIDGFFSWELLRWKTYDEVRKILDETITTLYLCKNSQYVEERELFVLLRDAALKGINGISENGVIKTTGLNSLKETYNDNKDDFVSKISTIITTRESKLHKI
jgi:hypothetical protein